MTAVWIVLAFFVGGFFGVLLGGVLAAGRDPERVYMGDPADMYDEGNS